MPVENWIILWKVLLVGGVALFAVLTVVVTVGGARDIAKLLRMLSAEQADDADLDQSMQ